MKKIIIRDFSDVCADGMQNKGSINEKKVEQNWSL